MDARFRGHDASACAAGAGAPPWRVMAVRPLPGYRLELRFADGAGGEVDMSALVTGADAGVFAALHEPEVFEAVGIAHGAVSWPNQIDLAPDSLHAAIKADGRCVLR
ncbi:MAG: DUF2442 domain-containing protein [Rhodanobacteraceae bacterium]|nr:DUF2442 domain-containing protein [Rhodanobacteraceae bacterium]